jgi:hypothetical protein
MKLEIGKRYNVLSVNLINTEYDMEYLGDTFVFGIRVHLFRDVEEPDFILSHSDKILHNYVKPTRIIK